MNYGLIGEHLPHSFSREVHERFGAYAYGLCELVPEEVAPFLEKRDFLGINVTIPYKQSVIPHLDEIDPSAEAVGAVNTVKNENGRLIGYNTDVEGMRAALAHYGISLKGKCVLILGTGGTSLTARAVAAQEGAKEILVCGRTGGNGILTYEEAYERAREVECILNTTPVGMYPIPDACPIELSRFPHLSGVFDAIYNPLRTDLVLSARERGIPAGGGLYMLVAQAVAAYGIFLGKEAPRALTERIFHELLTEKENAVLIGMPGCGKSTVGARLAELLGRKLYDTDREVIRADGREIPRIFEEEGEQGFREKESRAIAALARETGGVIATGGGAVLREENIRALKRNGRLLFLDRPLSLIHPTADRPTASDREALLGRYNERYPIYRRVADCRIDASLGVASVADATRSAFLEAAEQGENP